ncbi:E3 ubiquitin-protein ligase RNF25 [Mizuhopecten yessoensis]|uniref:E3 ubiquitin-protein ligase RNF25 n=1 Tax=Mizuhopecten yessoensis TaxID=6573 RepID=A0A210R6X2_MIZYE|nr:E3 ubiquitin-protein ligase RNF25 [Mizuhopecten yessoensis]
MTSIRISQGVEDEVLESLHKAINELAEERRGGHMLYDIIELAKESLTEGNVPHCPCTICLDHFSKGEEFTRTGCYHYFHRHCLYRYVTHTLESLKSEAHQRPKHDELGQEDRVKVLIH